MKEGKENMLRHIHIPFCPFAKRKTKQIFAITRMLKSNIQRCQLTKEDFKCHILMQHGRLRNWITISTHARKVQGKLEIESNSKRLRVLNRDRRQETRAVNNFTSAFEKYFTRRYPATTSNDSASFESNEIVEIKRGAVHAGSTHLPRIQLCWIAWFV